MKLFKYFEKLGRYKVLVQSGDIEKEAVKSEHIADGAVTSDKLADGAVTGDKLGDKSIEGRSIADKVIESRHLSDDLEIDTEHIAENAITEGKIADGAVVVGKIEDGAVKSRHIADEAVVAGKIAQSAVENRNLAPASVTEGNLAPGAVTSDKLAPEIISQLETITEAEPTPNSVLPVQSGGVYEDLTRIAFRITGIGNTPVYQRYKLVKAHDYVLYVLNPNWNTTGIPSGVYKLALSYVEDGTTKYLINRVAGNGTVADKYTFTTPNVDIEEYTLMIRAAVGEDVYIKIEDVTEVNSLSSEVFNVINGTSCRVIGKNTNIINTYPKLVSGHIYRINIVNPDWDDSSIGSNTKFGILLGETRVIQPISKGGTVLPSYTITVPEGNEEEYNIYFRATAGEEIHYAIEDITYGVALNNETVKFTNQSLTNEQKGQARENIAVFDDINLNINKVVGNNATIIEVNPALLSDKKYRINILNPDWDDSSIGSNAKFGLYDNSIPRKTLIPSKVIGATLESSYTFDTTGTTSPYTLFFRANRSVEIKYKIEDITDVNEQSVALLSKIAAVEDKIALQCGYIDGNNSTAVEIPLKLIPNHLYTLYLLNPDWDASSAGSNYKFALYYKNANDTTVYLAGPLSKNAIANSEYSFQTADEVTDYLLYFRSNRGERVYYVLQDVTTASTYKNATYYDIHRKARQMGQLKWTPKKDVRANEGLHEAGIEVTGVPYSSVKEFWKFVGMDVSLHTFMTAVNDENSLLYTERVDASGSRSAYGITYHGVNCTSYYGNVCSAFVSACLGLSVQFNSWEFISKYFGERFEQLPNQDENNLEVGDVLWNEGHVAIITAVSRNINGDMISCILEEQMAPIKKTRFSLPEIRRYRQTVNGIWSRYKKMYDNIDYTPSVFNLDRDEFLYRAFQDFCYQDAADGTRTFYRCRVNNKRASFVASDWNVIAVWQAGNSYAYNDYVSYAGFAYRSLVNDNVTTPTNGTYWERVERAYEWCPYPYVYNDDIVTFAGDRATFKSNDLIYINYTKGSFTQMQLFKDEVLIQTITLPNDDSYQINVSSYCAGYGMYKARLTDGTNYSRFTYFEVLDTSLSIVENNGTVTYNFSSANSNPLEIKVVELSGYPILHKPLTDEERQRGTIKIHPNAMDFAQVRKRHFDSTNELFANCLYQGYFGNAISNPISIGTLSDFTGEVVYPNEPKNLGTIIGSKNIILSECNAGATYSFNFVGSANASVNVIPVVGDIKWVTNIPTVLVAGTEYLVTVTNGIGNVVSCV